MRVRGKVEVDTYDGNVFLKVVEAKSGEPLAEATFTPEEWWDVLRGESEHREVTVDTFDLHARLGRKGGRYQYPLRAETEKKAWDELDTMLGRGMFAKWKDGEDSLPARMFQSENGTWWVYLGYFEPRSES